MPTNTNMILAPFALFPLLQAYDVVLYRTVFIVFPIVGAGILRSRCTRNHARRIGSLLLAFAYLQAGMLVAILSVLNFALATLLALLAYAALRIGVKTPSLSSLQPIPFSWLGSLRGPSIVLFHPVVPTWIIGPKFQLHIETLMTHCRLFNSATVPIVCVAYLPIILQAQVGIILRG